MTTLMTLCFLIFSRAISSVFNAKMPVAAAHLLKFPLPGKKKVFENQRFPLDNVGRYFGKTCSSQVFHMIPQYSKNGNPLSPQTTKTRSRSSGKSVSVSHCGELNNHAVRQPPHLLPSALSGCRIHSFEYVCQVFRRGPRSSWPSQGRDSPLPDIRPPIYAARRSNIPCTTTSACRCFSWAHRSVCPISLPICSQGSKHRCRFSRISRSVRS